MRLLKRQLWFRLALSGGLVGFFVWKVDIEQALRVFLEVRYVYVAPALALYTLSKLLDSYRWRLMLSRVGDASIWGLFGTFLVSNMANNYLPVRLGDLIRVQVPAQRYGLPRSGMTSTVFVTETLVDGVAFVLLALAAVALLDVPDPLMKLVWALLGLVLMGLILAGWAARLRLPPGWQERGWCRWLPSRAQQTINDLLPPFISGLAPLSDFRLGGRILLLSLVAWLLEAGMYWLLGYAFGLNVAVGAYILIMIAANMIVSMPLAPSNIGPYEVAVAEVVITLGAARHLASGFAIGTHLIVILWMTVCGLIAMWFMHLSFEDLVRFRRRTVAKASGPELA